jgi:hypothetical protein
MKSDRDVGGEATKEQIRFHPFTLGMWYKMVLYDQIKCNHCIVIAYFTAYRVYNGIDIITVEVGQVISDFVQKILLKMSSSSSSSSCTIKIMIVLHILYTVVHSSTIIKTVIIIWHRIFYIITSYTVYNKWYIDRVTVEVGQKFFFLKISSPSLYTIKNRSFYTYRIKIWSYTMYDAKYEMSIPWLHFI